MVATAIFPDIKVRLLLWGFPQSRFITSLSNIEIIKVLPCPCILQSRLRNNGTTICWPFYELHLDLFCGTYEDVDRLRVVSSGWLVRTLQWTFDSTKGGEFLDQLSEIVFSTRLHGISFRRFSSVESQAYHGTYRKLGAESCGSSREPESDICFQLNQWTHCITLLVWP
jgi:hypothetical protein